MTKYEGSVFQKVKSGLQVGIKLSWAKDTNATTFGVASKYTIDDVSSVCVSKMEKNKVLYLIPTMYHVCVTLRGSRAFTHI